MDGEPSNAGKIKKYSTKEVKKFEEAKDNREYDYEGEMAVTKLKTICRACEHLIKMMKPNTNLPEWVQAKIIKAEDYITTAHDYLMSEMNEETELSEAKCNMSEEGTMCEMHGIKKVAGFGQIRLKADFLTQKKLMNMLSKL